MNVSCNWDSGFFLRDIATRENSRPYPWAMLAQPEDYVGSLTTIVRTNSCQSTPDPFLTAVITQFKNSAHCPRASYWRAVPHRVPLYNFYSTRYFCTFCTFTYYSSERHHAFSGPSTLANFFTVPGVVHVAFPLDSGRWGSPMAPEPAATAAPLTVSLFSFSSLP